MRIAEVQRLRVKDVYFSFDKITVRDGKGVRGPRLSGLLVSLWSRRGEGARRTTSAVQWSQRQRCRRGIRVAFSSDWRLQQAPGWRFGGGDARWLGPPRAASHGSNLHRQTWDSMPYEEHVKEPAEIEGCFVVRRW